MFWKKKDDPETASTKALLAYLADLDTRNLIHWSSDTWDGAEMGQLVSVNGQAQRLCITLTYNKAGSQYAYCGYGGLRFSEAIFKSLRVSLEGNGMLELSDKTAPNHWYWCLDPHITLLMKRAEASLQRTKRMAEQSKIQSKIQNSEESAREILGHLFANSAS